MPENFNKLENIKEFRWGQCRQFPSQIYKCKSLETLTFDKSYFDSIPAGISRLSNLRKLNLSFGVFQELPNDFDQLSSIVELELTGSEIIKLPEMLSNLKLLKGIDLQYCKSLKDAENVIMSLKGVDNLEWLILGDSGLTEEKQALIKTELGLQK